MYDTRTGSKPVICPLLVLLLLLRRLWSVALGACLSVSGWTMFTPTTALRPSVDPQLQRHGLALDAWSKAMMSASAVLGALLLLLPVDALHSKHVAVRSSRSAVAVTMAAGSSLVSEYMTPIADAVVLDPAMNLREAADLLQQKHITGAPVVSDQKLVGVLSQFDFLFKAAGTGALNLEADTYATDVKKILGGNVQSVMTTDPVTFSPDDPVSIATPTADSRALPNHMPDELTAGRSLRVQVSAVASIMIKRRFNHVPIIEGETVVGIIRSTDVMRYVLSKS